VKPGRRRTASKAWREKTRPCDQIKLLGGAMFDRVITGPWHAARGPGDLVISAGTPW
jgi:hypothetical protein